MLVKPKLTAIFLLAALLQTCVRTHAQNISLSEKKAPLQKVFRDIEKQTDYLFWYEYPLLEHTAKVTIKVDSIPLAKALDLCLKGQSLKYTIIKKTIVVTASDGREVLTGSPNTLPIEIGGKVTDTSGAPLGGVSVSVLGSTIGTATDEQGNFRLAVSRNDTLHATLISYQPVDIEVKKNTSFNIVMGVVKSSMNDVVVVGYGSLSKKKYYWFDLFCVYAGNRKSAAGIL